MDLLYGVECKLFQGPQVSIHPSNGHEHLVEVIGDPLCPKDRGIIGADHNGVPLSHEVSCGVAPQVSYQQQDLGGEGWETTPRQVIAAAASPCTPARAACVSVVREGQPPEGCSECSLL